MFRNKPLRSSRKIKKRKRAMLVRLLISVIVIVIVIVATSWLSSRPGIRIEHIAVVGAAMLTDAEVQEYVAQKLSGKYLFLFPKSNIFLFPRRSIKEGFLDTFPELSHVNVSFEDFQSIAVAVGERTPYALWCGTDAEQTRTDVEQTTNTKAELGIGQVRDDGEDLKFDVGEAEEPECYFFDDEGVIFTKAPLFSASVFFELYGPISGKEIRKESTYESPLGFRVLPEQIFKKVIDFKNALEGWGIAPRKLIVREDGDYEFILKNGVRILFNNKQDFEIVLDDLDVALETESLQKEDLILEDSSLEYIDVRFDNKVYYKFKIR